MSKIKIKVEGLQTRCEICHQADCYDPQTNSCKRCEELKAKLLHPFKFDTTVKTILHHSNVLTFMMVFGLPGLAVILLGCTEVLREDFKALFCIGFPFVLIAFLIPLRLFIKCRKVIWVIKNVKPIMAEVKVYTPSDTYPVIVDIYFPKSDLKGIAFHYPKWDIKSIANKSVPAQVYSYPKVGIVISTDQGLLLNIT